MDNKEDACETSVNPESPSPNCDQNNSTPDHIPPESSKPTRHQYTRDQLLAWKDVRCSRLKPPSMSKDYESSEGIWDPEKWFNSTIGDNNGSVCTTSNYNSHFTTGEKMYSRGRKPEWDADDNGRRVVNKMLNDKGLKQSIGDADVVLMPQRNFNSGCYVNSNETQHRREVRDQKFNQRMIGSGRIPVVDRFKGRSDDVNDGWIERGGSGRPRGKPNDKRFESGGRSDYKSCSRDMRKSQPPEPLWYRDGPLSQDDTIELHGFNDQPEEYHGFERMKRFNTKPKDDKIMEEVDEDKKVEGEIDKGPIAVDNSIIELSSTCDNAKESKIESLVQSKPCDSTANATEFDFDLFAKAVSNPNKLDSEVESRESRFRQFFQTQSGPESITNGVIPDKKVLNNLMPPPPPVYGHSIEKFIDTDEEKKNFLTILQKAQISYQTHQMYPPTHSRTPNLDGSGSQSQMPASLKELESGIKAMLKVNNDLGVKSQNSAPGAYYGPLFVDSRSDGSVYASPGPNKNLAMNHKPLPVGSRVTRVSDLEAGSVLSESFVSRDIGQPDMRNAEPEDMSAYNKLLGLIVSQKSSQNHSLANHNYNEAYPISTCSPNYSNQMVDSSICSVATSHVNSLLASMNNDKRQAHSPSVRSSPIAFGTCPPTNLATPMPIHAGHLINQFVSNGTKVQFNNHDPSLKYGTQNSIDHPSKESMITPQGLDRMPSTFFPTSVIRQMAQDKAGSAKVAPQDSMWTMFRSNAGENNAPVFKPPIYNTQAPHTFSMHNQLQPPIPGMSVFSRPPQQPSVASFLQCLQQGRVIPQPQQHQQILHPLQQLQQQINNNLPPKRAIVKGANISSHHQLPLNPEQQNLSLGNHVALQPGHVLGNAQVDQPPQAIVMAALQHALISKHRNPNSGFEGWHNGAPSVNGSSVGRTPNQVKLQ